MNKIEIKKVQQFKGLLITCSISWYGTRKSYDEFNEKDYAKIEIWWDNTKGQNDNSGEKITAYAYRPIVGEELWSEIKYWYNANRNWEDFFSIVVDEQNRVLDFKRDKELKTLVKMKRASGLRGKEVFEL